ncbi:MAG: hypothetical protein J3K34DRAFT_408397 [Monoraphidium minutum]|nr:MAG: hypothetical protein J3K34DRAFT_408397 [Monoraphidium minutum]
MGSLGLPLAPVAAPPCARGKRSPEEKPAAAGWAAACARAVAVATPTHARAQGAPRPGIECRLCLRANRGQVGGACANMLDARTRLEGSLHQYVVQMQTEDWSALVGKPGLCKTRHLHTWCALHNKRAFKSCSCAWDQGAANGCACSPVSTAVPGWSGT